MGKDNVFEIRMSHYPKFIKHLVMMNDVMVGSVCVCLNFYLVELIADAPVHHVQRSKTEKKTHNERVPYTDVG